MSRIIFFGTPIFSEIILNHLINAGYFPIAVVTNPDQPVGRKQVLTPSPVKLYASKHRISVLQPQKLKDTQFLNELRAFQPDVFIIASYGKILPAELLAIPPKGTINVHPSLLPKYRGATPIQTAILNGDTETGVTLMLTDEKMDHGPVLAKSEIRISKSETYTSLHDKLADAGGKLLTEILPRWLAGEITPQKQNYLKATFTKLLTKEDGRINWNKSAEEIERQIRAFEIWPGTWTTFGSPTSQNSEVGLPGMLRVKIISAHVSDEPSSALPGMIVKTKSGELAVATRDYLLIVESLQSEGKNLIDGGSFLNGHPEILLGNGAFEQSAL